MIKKLKTNSYLKDCIIGIFAIAIYLIFGIMSFPNENTVNNFNPTMYIFFAIFTSIIILYIYFKEIKDEAKQFFKHTVKNLLICLLVFVICFFVVILGNNISYLITNTSKANSISLIFPNMKALLYYTLFVMLLYTPFVESMIFNKVFNKIIKNKVLFVVLSSIIFGILQIGINFNNLKLLVLAIPYCLLQVIMSILYLKKQNIFFPIFTWMIYYGVQLIVQSSAFWA